MSVASAAQRQTSLDFPNKEVVVLQTSTHRPASAVSWAIEEGISEVKATADDLVRIVKFCMWEWKDLARNHRAIRLRHTLSSSSQAIEIFPLFTQIPTEQKMNDPRILLQSHEVGIGEGSSQVSIGLETTGGVNTNPTKKGQTCADDLQVFSSKPCARCCSCGWFHTNSHRAEQDQSRRGWRFHWRRIFTGGFGGGWRCHDEVSSRACEDHGQHFAWHSLASAIAKGILNGSGGRATWRLHLRHLNLPSTAVSATVAASRALRSVARSEQFHARALRSDSGE